MSEPAMIDWDFAVQTARRLIRPGPMLSSDEMHEVVDSLRSGAATAQSHVREHTQLDATTATSPVLVVDRGGWVEANADGFSRVVQPLVDKVESENRSLSSVVGSFGSRVTGAEAGALMAFLAHKVLGQFDPFGGDAARRGDSAGRLLLIAPNIVAAEREMEVDPDDFRLWVCLHEETHRVQFSAVPWLRDHLLREIGAFVEATDVDADRVRGMMTDGLRNVTELVRGGSGSLLDVFTSVEQRSIIDRVTAVMSLLEGHADVVMDGVGPAVVPSVGTIRSRFDKRRQGRSQADRLLRRLLGLDAKMRQYADGAGFVNAVVDRVGMTGFNAVWSGPEQLPTAAEIADPAVWLRRVHG